MKIKDSKDAAAYLVDTIRSGKTTYGEHPTIAGKGYYQSLGGGYSPRLFDVWGITPSGKYVQHEYFLFFKRAYYEKFAEIHGFKHDPSAGLAQFGLIEAVKDDELGMTVTLSLLEGAVKRKAYILIVMEDGTIWDKYAPDWLGWCKQYESHGVIRPMKIDNNGGALEAAIGISQLRKVFPLA